MKKRHEPLAMLGDRSHFPDLEPRAYLNHAGISPPSVPLREAVRAVLDSYASRGAAAFPAWMEQRARLKQKLARLVGARPEDLGLVQSTTRGVNDVALCFPWTKGDRVVCFVGEFPANVTPWQRAAELFGLEVVLLPLADFLESDARGLERVEDELCRGARLVAVSAVEFSSGLRMPLAELAALCHARGAELFVDGVQACGAVPIDVGALGVDYLACGGHKWMMAVEGTGFLYVRPDRVRALRKGVAGWLSHEDGVGFLFEGPGRLRYDRPVRERADFVEGGNLNAMGFAGMEAALDLLQSLGVEAIHAHANALLDALEPALVARGFQSLRAKEPARRSAILGVLPPVGVDVVDLHHALARLGVACATPDGVLRFSPHWPNALGEAALVVDAVDEALAGLRRGS
jgi:selenocysteine lyase/cysteine desulfurase